jgi:hypothetical protein
MGSYLRHFYGQRLSKRVPVAMVTHATGETGCCLCQGVIRKRTGATSQFSWALQGMLRRDSAVVVSRQLRVEFCTGGCEDRTWVLEAEESPMSVAIAREWLVKTLQVGEDLACSDLLSVEFSDSAVITCNSEQCVRGLTIKFANSTPCACLGSSGQKPQYGFMMAYQHFAAVLLLIYGNLLLSVFWCAVENVGASC